MVKSLSPCFFICVGLNGAFFLLSWLVGLECGCLPFFLCLNTLFAAYLVDLSQERWVFALFLKKSSQNICKFEINALPLQSLSLQNKNGASEKRSSLTDWHRRGNSMAASCFRTGFGNGLEGYKLLERIIQCRV